jgi:hypothetical protein
MRWSLLAAISVTAPTIFLFRNNSTGDTRIEAISNGNFSGWHQVGGSNTGYTVKT